MKIFRILIQDPDSSKLKYREYPESGMEILPVDGARVYRYKYAHKPHLSYVCMITYSPCLVCTSMIIYSPCLVCTSMIIYSPCLVCRYEYDHIFPMLGM